MDQREFCLCLGLKGANRGNAVFLLIGPIEGGVFVESAFCTDLLRGHAGQEQFPGFDQPLGGNVIAERCAGLLFETAADLGLA